MNSELYSRVLGGETLTVDLNFRSKWKLSGPDAPRYLNGQVTGDMLKLAENHVAYVAACTAKGRLEGDLFAVRHDGVFFMDAAAELQESLGARLEKYLIADDAVLEDVTATWSLSHVFGTAGPSSLPPDSFAASHARFGVPGHDVWVPGTESFLTGEKVDDETVDILRLEAGLPLWGAELSSATLPPEAGPAMERAISYTKGCYVGQEIIARLKSVGQTPRTLVFLRGETAAFPKTGTELKQGEKMCGTMTSSGFSPRLEKGIALAYVPRAVAVEGTIFETNEGKWSVARPLTTEKLS